MGGPTRSSVFHNHQAVPKVRLISSYISYIARFFQPSVSSHWLSVLWEWQNELLVACLASKNRIFIEELFLFDLRVLELGEIPGCLEYLDGQDEANDHSHMSSTSTLGPRYITRLFKLSSPFNYTFSSTSFNTNYLLPITYYLLNIILLPIIFHLLLIVCYTFAQTTLLTIYSFYPLLTQL